MSDIGNEKDDVGGKYYYQFNETHFANVIINALTVSIRILNSSTGQTFKISPIFFNNALDLLLVV